MFGTVLNILDSFPSVYLFNNHTNEEGGKMNSKDYQRNKIKRWLQIFLLGLILC